VGSGRAVAPIFGRKYDSKEADRSENEVLSCTGTSIHIARVSAHGISERSRGGLPTGKGFARSSKA
jgi:hypothetical protein